MNLIVLCSDTYRVDYLSCYNPQSVVQTPHLDRLAAEGIRFQNAFGEGTPTLPARRVLYTGRRIFPFLWVPQKSDRVQLPGWHPLFYEDVTLAEWLTDQGYETGLISDLPHQFKPGKNFHRGFTQFDWVRGQEMDAYRSGPKTEVPIERFLPAGWERQAPLTTQFLMNARAWKTEADWSSAQVIQKGMDYLRENQNQQPFMLWLEAFFPHEPWYAPPELVEKYYDGDYDGVEWIFPPATAAAMTSEQAARVRAHYAGLCELIDRWFGRLMETAADLGLLDDTMIVFLSDHGTMMGEQGQYHKGQDRLRWQVTQVPLLIRLPDGRFAGRVVEPFVQHQDLLTTLLPLLGLPVPERCTGRDLVAAHLNSDEPGPDRVVTSFGWYAAVRSRDWNYLTPWVEPDFAGIPAGQRTLMAPQLYDLGSDPDELTDVAERHPEVVADYHHTLLAYAAEGRALTRGSLDASEAAWVDVPLDDPSRI